MMRNKAYILTEERWHIFSKEESEEDGLTLGVLYYLLEGGESRELTQRILAYVIKGLA